MAAADIDSAIVLSDGPVSAADKGGERYSVVVARADIAAVAPIDNLTAAQVGTAAAAPFDNGIAAAVDGAAHSAAPARSDIASAVPPDNAAAADCVAVARWAAEIAKEVGSGDFEQDKALRQQPTSG